MSVTGASSCTYSPCVSLCVHTCCAFRNADSKKKYKASNHSRKAQMSEFFTIFTTLLNANLLTLSSLFALMTTTHVQRPLLASKKQPVSHQPYLVRVGGRYRVGKLLGTGGSGERHSDQVRLFFLSSLASVFLGKDIRTGNEVALKIGHVGSSPSKLSYEHNVYTMISGSTGISQVLWYGKEGLHEVIVLEYLGTSLGDLICERRFDLRRTFLYASQMVRLLYM
jgi:hypothetical protein